MMTLFNLERIDTSLLYPRFLERMVDVLSKLNTSHTVYVATEGFRTFNEQQRLYFKGRTLGGAQVTNAQGGLSAHNYGLALDFVRMFEGKTASWEAQDYDALGEESVRASLVWGGKFTHPDRPHVQWPGFVDAMQLAPLKRIWTGSGFGQAGKLEVAWAYVTSEHPTIPDAKLPEGLIT